MKIFVLTGEVSGDLHLSYLVQEAKKIDNSVEFIGVAGNHCRAQGVEVIQDIDELSIMGFTEVLKKYSFLKRKSEEYLEYIKKEKIKKVIMVDYGGFNLKFLKLLKSEIPDIEVSYYIPPKLWIWGEKRIDTLKLADRIMVIFPWEVPFYKKHNVESIYYGNPFTERYEPVYNRGENILLLPGSRKQEIKSLIPELLKIVEREKGRNFILKLSSEEHLKWIDYDLTQFNNLKVSYRSLKEVVLDCNIAIAASGTVTLELALLNIPTIVIYKTNYINYFIAKYILKVGFISLPNLTVNEEVFPELIQGRCNSEEIINELEKIEKNLSIMDKKLKIIRERLEGKNVTKSYAELLLKGKRDEK